MSKNRQQAELKNVLNVDPKRFHPLHDQALLTMELETQTSGGIIVPHQAQQNGLLVGLVVEAGPEVKRAKVGERVLVNPRDVRVSKIDTLLWLAPDATLLAKVDPKPVIQAVGVG